MADKKITIKPDDMQRLQELLRQQEAKLDAANPSDAELSQWESRLDDSVRKLAQNTADTLPSPLEEMDRNWVALQQKLKDTPKAAPEPPRIADVLPFKRLSKNKILPFLGLAVAAALAIIVVRAPTDDRLTMNEASIQIKGTGGSTAAADCEVNAAANSGPNVSPSADGMGFVGAVGSDVEIIFRCSSSGFMQARLQGPESITLVTPVIEGERQRILRDGQIARISLQSGQAWSIGLVLTDKEPAKDQVVPPEHVLWQDQIMVGARE